MMTLSRASVASDNSHAAPEPAVQEPRHPALELKRKINRRRMAALFVGAVLSPLLAPVFLAAEPRFPETTPVQFRLFKTTDVPQALVLAVHGKCEYSEDGATFTPLRAGRVFKKGAVVRTGSDGRTDLFFRRTGTTVRLQAGTEIRLEKMKRQMKRGKPVLETLLDVRTGRIFIVVRSLVTGSTLEIRNGAGRAVVEGGGGKGRYIVTADGTHVTEKGSAVPLKVFGETGITVIRPGQKFSAKEGKLFALEPPEGVALMIDFDELDALAEHLMQSKKRKGIAHGDL